MDSTRLSRSTPVAAARSSRGFEAQQTDLLSATRPLAQANARASEAGDEASAILAAVLLPFVDDASAVAKALYACHRSLASVLVAPTAVLAKIPGMTDSAAGHLSLLRALTEAVALERLASRPVIGGSESLNAYLRTTMRGHRAEQARGLFLDRRNHLICDVLLAEGTIDKCPLYDREVARKAIELDASALILVHNHPSGDPEPSSSDIESTRKLRAALATLDITLHDHVIVGSNDIVSLRNRRLM
jgi:DNA repair protein RadC